MTGDKIDRADKMRERLQQIIDKAPLVGTDEACSRTLADWRTICRDMASIARAALSEANGKDKKNG